MKRLTLLRHANTERESVSGRDLDRRLTDGGRADAERIGEAIRALGLTFDIALCSTARRAAETAELARLAVRAEPRIYEASTADLLDLVHGVAEEAASLILVGHNPGFERLLGRLVDAELEMPTGSLAELAVSAERWGEVQGGSGQLLRFLKPKEMG